jgi:hypothetical protein
MANPGLSIRARFDRKVSEERIGLLSLGGVFLEKNNPPVENFSDPLHVLKLRALGCEACEMCVSAERFRGRGC